MIQQTMLMKKRRVVNDSPAEDNERTINDNAFNYFDGMQGSNNRNNGFGGASVASISSESRQHNNERNNDSQQRWHVSAIVMMLFGGLVAFMTVIASATAAVDMTQPTLLLVSPANNERDLATNEQVIASFSEEMDPLSINAQTFIVTQRPTPEFGQFAVLRINGSVQYAGRTATFTPTEILAPNQHYGNVFTATMTNMTTDLAGNPLAQEYVWSFTTGENRFNAGVTTSQSNQSMTAAELAAASAAATPPPTVAVPSTGALTPASTAPASTGATSFQAMMNNPVLWAWVIGAALVVILVVVFVSGARKSRTVEIIETKRSKRFDGDALPIAAIEGIGKQYTKGLNAMGIKNTKQLFETDASKIARLTNAPLKSVRSWQHMAELASVKDIGPQYAELLERSGVHSIDQLTGYTTDELLVLVREKQDSLGVNIQGNSPGYATVEHWIASARDHAAMEE